MIRGIGHGDDEKEKFLFKYESRIPLQEAPVA